MVSRWPLISSRGLSPRVRGNPPHSPERPGHRRSIPACAGEPPPLPGPARLIGVYPRVCGGTTAGLRKASCCTGLSPRVRGNHQQPDDSPPPAGSIPACAGEPVKRQPGPPRQQVYPRVCGGTESAGEPKVRAAARSMSEVYPRVCGGTRGGGHFRRLGQGLSPRVRGNRRQGWQSRYPLRSIPACAGEPRRRLSAPLKGRVYPRVCGGTGRRAGRRVGQRGLSPRVRGNLRPRESGPDWRRSIPACAGEPRRCAAPGCAATVYPRVCGGTGFRNPQGVSLRGLSPRVRGNPSRSACCPPSSRSIPACAGEPGSKSPTPCQSEVYPRVCGGTGFSAQRRPHTRGLSPRVRGNPLPPLRT